MKILQANNFFRSPGGEAAVIENERLLLESKGHQVELFAVTNDWAGGLGTKIRVALRAAHSPHWKKQLLLRIQSSRPDVVHVHNFFPILTPSIYDACLEEGVPIVHTLHNHRLICPASLLWRHGHVCEDCLHGNPYLSAFHRCYRHSFTATLAAAHMVARFHRTRGFLKVRAYIALTEFGRSKFIEAGFPPGLVSVKPNFLGSASDTRPGEPGGHFALFVGRLVEGKGLPTLLRAWRSLGQSVPLTIVGEGPLRPLVEEAARTITGITYLGYKPNAEVLTLMKAAKLLVFPSESYEGFPMTIVEAFAAGVPVVASRLGAMSVIIRPGVCGEFFEPGNADSLATRVASLVGDEQQLQALRQGAREEFEERYTAERNYLLLMDIYRKAGVW